MDKSINNDTPIMGNCLSCQGLVRVPATAPTSSTVKCPHCGESFRLSQILNHAVPELEIVVEDEEQEDDIDQEGAVKDSEGRFVVAKQLRQSSKKSRRGRRRSRSRRSPEADGMVPVPKPIGEVTESATAIVDEVDGSQFSVNDSKSQSNRESFDSRRSSGSSSRSSSSESSRSRSSGRSRSRSTPKKTRGSNPVGEIFKVVLGGAMAIPIAYLLVLWVFKQDPLDVAPKIYKTAPYLVPAAFQIDEEESSDSDDDAEGDVTDGLDEDALDVSGGLAKPRLDPSKVGIN